MATVTSIKTGDWGTAGTWDSGVPVNGDTVIIAEGHEVRFNVNQSGFANGLAALTINGILHFINTANTCLKMNGNITGTGRLYVAQIWEMDPVEYEYELVTGYSNVYKDSGIAWLETLAGVDFTEVESIDEVESTPNSFYKQFEEYVEYTYWHQADATCRVFTAINRAAPGSEYRCYLLFNSTGTINLPSIKMFGYYDELEYTQLSADASAGQNQIVLNEDLDLQEGDVIAITRLAEEYALTETVKGIYAVSSYDSGTKTVTLSSNLELSRGEGDYVCWVSRPIKLARTSSTSSTNLVYPYPDLIDNGVIIGVKSEIRYTFNPMGENWIIKHCSNTNRVFINTVFDSLIEDCISTSAYHFLGPVSGEVNRLISIDNPQDLYCSNIKFTDCKTFHSILHFYPSFGEYFNQLLTHMGTGEAWCEGNFHDSEIHFGVFSKAFIGEMNCNNCEIIINKEAGLRGTKGKFYNCIFSGEYGIGDLNTNNRQVNEIIESFDHNQISGNYKAWMKGGTIETLQEESEIVPGKLVFNCESDEHPVFYDTPINLPANRAVNLKIGVEKDIEDIDCKLQIIKEGYDPLINNEENPLAESKTDTTTTPHQIGVSVKVDEPVRAFVRVIIEGKIGSVTVDTKNLEQMLAKKRIV